MDSAMLQLLISLTYVVFFFVLSSQVGRWRKRRMAALFDQLPERSRNLMVKEPWLKVPPLPEFRTDEDAAYRQAFRRTKWPGRFVWIGFFALIPGFNWMMDKAFQ